MGVQNVTVIKNPQRSLNPIPCFRNDGIEAQGVWKIIEIHIACQ